MSNKIPKIVQQITYWPIYSALRLLLRYQIEGQENLKGLEDKGVIFASNHASCFDGPICAAAMPREGLVPKRFLPVRFLAARQYCEWFNPKNFPFPVSLLTTAYVKMNGSIPVNVGMAGFFEEKLREAIRNLRTGTKLWIYPEGQRTPDGKIQPGKKGAVFLQKSSGAPIVPVGVIGTFKISFFKKVKIRIGKPFFLPENVSLEEGAEIVMKKIAALLK
jgi:1-acyl-sn-glycerol-3-phosphate acyltransferase